MKRKRQSKITDLNYDVLKNVMYHVAASPDGAGNLARTLSVLFKELADDSDILKAVAFDQVELSDIHESFWQPAGMLCRCLPTGNSTAFYAIRQKAEILNVSYLLLKRDMFRGKLILLARSRALEIANTRARKKALEDAIDVVFRDVEGCTESNEKSDFPMRLSCCRVFDAA
ncbi:putative phosphate transporter PHO1 -like protein 3-like [Capsicum annuum]|nr:putative phosphate transporter PHO1 -like protein 3-like [Capsicum annuum]